MEYDYIINGFGGLVSALRLSKKGYNCLVIEKKNGSMLRISLKPIEFKNDFGFQVYVSLVS
jgi:phytoene dehydrogenase-like protein